MKKSKLYKYRKPFKMLFWLATLVVYIAAILPNDVAPVVPELSDKAHHVFAFLILGFLLRLAYNVDYWYALLLLVSFGALIEVSQYFTPTRYAEYQDIVADLIGVFIGLKMYKHTRRVI